MCLYLWGQSNTETGCPRRLQSLCPRNTFKTWLASALGNLLQLTLLEQVVGLGNAQRSLPTSAIPYKDSNLCNRIPGWDRGSADTEGDISERDTLARQLPFSNLHYFKISYINTCLMVSSGHRSFRWRSELRPYKQRDSTIVGSLTI